MAILTMEVRDVKHGRVVLRWVTGGKVSAPYRVVFYDARKHNAESVTCFTSLQSARYAFFQKIDEINGD